MSCWVNVFLFQIYSTMGTTLTNIIIADQNEIYREGLKMIIEKTNWINIVAIVSNRTELLDVLKKNKSDVVLFGLESNDFDEFANAKNIVEQFKGIKVIVLTMFFHSENLVKAINSCINGFLPKASTRKEFEKAIRLVIEGKAYYPVHNNLIINNLKSKIMKTSKILIVDDDIDVITVMETILTKKGYKVITAMDKREGMLKVREEKPDLAILDVMMTTHYEGFELAKEIVEDPELKSMPVLMQTSIEVLITTRPDVQEMAREFRKNPGFKDLHVLLVKDIATGKAGIDYLSEQGQSLWFPVNGFIPKPVDPSKLMPIIDKILNIKSN